MYQIIAILLLPFALTACDNITKQWIEPDKEFAAFEQPDVPTQQGLLEKAAKDSLAKGDYARAAQFYKQLADKSGNTEEETLNYQVAYGDTTRRSGDFEKAMRVFEVVLKDKPNHVEALEGKGLALMAQGNTQEAGEAFQDVMKLDAGRWRTLNGLAILFATRDLVPEAMAYYAEALRISPNNAAVLNNVGLSQAMIANWPRALKAMQQAVRAATSDSRRRQVEMNQALVYGISGDLESARKTASKHVEGPALDNNLGLYAYLSNNKELATTYLNQALTGSTTYYERAWKNLDLINAGNNQ